MSRRKLVSIENWGEYDPYAARPRLTAKEWSQRQWDAEREAERRDYAERCAQRHAAKVIYFAVPLSALGLRERRP